MYSLYWLNAVLLIYLWSKYKLLWNVSYIILIKSFLRITKIIIPLNLQCLFVRQIKVANQGSFGQNCILVIKVKY
jgi:hypothetical protein